jgi:hypothetical protein
MKNKRIGMLLLCVLLFAAGFCAGRSNREVHAQEAIRDKIPANFGHCVGSVSGGLVFEDSSGNVRITDMHGSLQAEYDRN